MRLFIIMTLLLIGCSHLEPSQIHKPVGQAINLTRNISKEPAPNNIISKITTSQSTTTTQEVASIAYYRQELEINTLPTGASIYLDNNYIGKTPKIIYPISAGKHKLRLEKTNVGVYENEFRILAGKKMMFNIDLRRYPTAYTLSISTIPKEAQVFINDVAYGFSPISRNLPMDREYHIRVVKTGYLNYDKTIKLSRDTFLNLRLRKYTSTP